MALVQRDVRNTFSVRAAAAVFSGFLIVSGAMGCHARRERAPAHEREAPVAVQASKSAAQADAGVDGGNQRFCEFRLPADVGPSIIKDLEGIYGKTDVTKATEFATENSPGIEHDCFSERQGRYLDLLNMSNGQAFIRRAKAVRFDIVSDSAMEDVMTYGLAAVVRVAELTDVPNDKARLVLLRMYGQQAMRNALQQSQFLPFNFPSLEDLVWFGRAVRDFGYTRVHLQILTFGYRVFSGDNLYMTLYDRIRSPNDY